MTRTRLQVAKSALQAARYLLGWYETLCNETCEESEENCSDHLWLCGVGRADQHIADALRILSEIKDGGDQ